MISDIGYKEVEFSGPYSFSAMPKGSAVKPGADSGYYGHTPSEVKQMLDDYGLAAPSAHIPLTDFKEKINEAIDAAHILGHEYLVCPFLEGKDRQSIDNYKKLAEQFNDFGKTCNKAGIQFAYHNHSFEFGKIDGRLPYDVLLDNTDKDLVKMELDLFWISISGIDPVEYFKKYPGRFPLCHCKNMETNKTLQDPLHSLDNEKLAAEAFDNQSDLSKGVIDFKHIFSQSERQALNTISLSVTEPRTLVLQKEKRL
jgi:sugar phosphate isomerase/epimerase